MRTAILALGSNLGDREEHLRRAVAGLRQRGIEVRGVAAIYETPAVGIPGGGDFLNTAVEVRTDLSPEALLRVGWAIEAEAGRVRALGGWSSRTLDVDVVLFEGETRNSRELTLPHPRLTERPFVLAPLLDLAPDWIVNGKSITSWANEADISGMRRLQLRL